MFSSIATRTAVAVFAATTLTAGGARAASPSPAEAALAQSLFDEARQLFGSRRYHEACEKFASSQKLDPRDGTLLDLAICHEKEGKTASAWLEFSEARTNARAQGRADREKFAGEHVDRLAPVLSHLRIQLPAEGRPEGLVVKIDGAAISDVALGSDLPIDPGDHTLDATAPDHAPWQRTVTVGDHASSKLAVDIPTLALIVSPPMRHPEDVHTPEGLPKAAPSASDPSGGRRVAGFVVGGVGLAGVAIGSVFGLKAIGMRHDAEGACNPTCGASAQSLNSDGVTDAWVSDIAFGVGAVGLVVGAYLVLTKTATTPPLSPSASRSSHPHASLAFTGRGFVVAGGW